MKRWRDESACSYCGDDGLGKKDAERMGRERVVLLHNVHHNGRFQLLCTNCVLINHPGLFCPICLLPFDSTPPLPVSHRLMCLRCPSIAHPSCSSSSSSSSFLCPPCSSLHPSRFRFFSTTAATLQKDNAKALVAAATISASSLHRAALAARADADRLLSDALSAKKRAVQALDLLSRLISSSPPPLPTPTISPPSFDQHHPQT